MDSSTLLLFAATVLPLVCTPGPDMLFVVAQSLAGGHQGAVRANAGIVLGYTAHSMLGALGVAAIVATSPMLLDVLRLVGIAYLAYLALQMFRSAMRPGTATLEPAKQRASLVKGFLTSFLNPKGILIYIAILPNFMRPSDSAHGIAIQALALSAVFIGLCATVYAVLGATIATMGRKGAASDRARRFGEGFAGGLLVFAAIKMGSRA